jgi:hypothetical protein
MTAPRLTGSRCVCRGCGQYFNSTSAFDLHRVGKPEARRCLSTDEMVEAGMTRNAGGFWVSRVMPTHRARAKTREIPADLRATPLPSQRGESAGRQFGTDASPEHQIGSR